ncbi:hypothetical protein ACIO13_28240 [Streptomyces sp. NPDC087425]|uniref:hypothetical protein n=1 Tax=unclassified Streptomyces TaxID=2593676 RepID=UPI0038177D1B
MARHSLTTTAAFTVAATLLLSGCGGGDDTSSGGIKGADQGSNSPSANASSSAKTPSGVKRPAVVLPSSFDLTFEKWTDEDPVKQAALDDGKEQLRAGYAAIIANETQSKALTFYNTRESLLQVQQWIRSYTDKNLTVMGKLPVFDPKVTISSTRTSAALSYCTDESKAYSKQRKTGDVAGNPAGTDPKIFYLISLAKNAQGVWQTVSAQSERGGCSQ